jgi:hypothetical protein
VLLASSFIYIYICVLLHFLWARYS